MRIPAAVRSAARINSRSSDAAALFHSLMTLPPGKRRTFLSQLDERELSQVLAVAAHEGGTPYALWKDDPVGFVVDVLRENTWSKPREILSALPYQSKIAVPSCFSSGKCVYRQEMIMLADGTVAKAEDLIGREFEVLGWREDGTQTIRRARASWNAIEPVYRITAGDGRQIVRNGGHPLYAADKVRRVRGGYQNGTVSATPENIGWRETKNLQIGDLVLVPEVVRPSLTERMPFEQAALLGYLLGDGHTGREVRFSHLPGETLDEFIACVEALGSQVKDYPSKGKHRELVVRSTGKRDESRTHRHLINPVWNLVKEWGLAGKKATEKRFPEFVWRLHLEDLAVVLSRLFACDGWATFGKNTKSPKASSLGISLANEPLVKDVQRAMLRFGINGRIHRKNVRSGGKVFPYWEWTVNSAVDLRRFADAFTVPGKQANIEAAAQLAATRRHTLLWPHRSAPAGYRWEKIKSIEPLGEQGTVAIEVDVDHTWVDLFVEHNTWSASRALLWFAFTHPPGQVQVITMAPTWRQTARLLWTEVRFAHGRANLPGKVDMVQMKLPMMRGHDEVVAYGLSGAPTNEHGVQGIHKQNLLLIVDEAGGISHVVGNNLRGMTSTEGSRMLAIGNPPTDEEGSWFEGLCSRPEEALVIPISAMDTPSMTDEEAPLCRTCFGDAEHRVTKHLVTPKFVKETIAEHGEDSNYVQAKVYARFPRGGPNRVLPSLWVDMAADMPEPEGDTYVALNELGLAEETAEWKVGLGSWVRLGVDVAADGGDECVVARSVGDMITIEHISANSANVHGMDVAGMILMHIRKADALRKALGTQAPVKVKVDANGLGWNVADVLRAWGEEGSHEATIVPVMVSELTHREPDGATLRPYRKRDEMWLATRALLQPDSKGRGSLRLRVDRRTLAQLMAPTMRSNSGGMTIVESKESMKGRGLTSGDRAEACLMSVYEPLLKPIKKKSRLIAI